MNPILLANSTSRSRGAVGARAIVPRYVVSIATPIDTILDFGAGKDAIHTAALKGKGLNVTAHEFGANQNEKHDSGALFKTYSIVFASNVLNVQSDSNTLYETVRSIWDAVGIGGRAVFNYPESPRKMDISTKMMKSIVETVLDHSIHQVGGTARAPIWEVRK